MTALELLLFRSGGQVRVVGSAAGQTFVQLDTDVLLEPLLP
jgi:hypothetical protein